VASTTTTYALPRLRDTGKGNKESVQWNMESVPTCTVYQISTPDEGAGASQEELFNKTSMWVVSQPELTKDIKRSYYFA
jgi:hypothetical protein